tara:strand:+ start:760 stop:1023 length:264 start_codon:yes stop_codon:yes gene_type:complete
MNYAIDRVYHLNQCISLATKIADEHGFTLHEMTSDRRAKALVIARREYFNEAFKKTKASTVIIGRAIDKDHTTVMHALKRQKELQGS